MTAQEARAALDALLDAPEEARMARARDAFIALSALRDALWRDGAPAPRLARVNAALSLAWGGAIPAAGFRRERIEAARAALEEA